MHKYAPGISLDEYTSRGGLGIVRYPRLHAGPPEIMVGVQLHLQLRTQPVAVHLAEHVLQWEDVAVPQCANCLQMPVDEAVPVEQQWDHCVVVTCASCCQLPWHPVACCPYRILIRTVRQRSWNCGFVRVILCLKLARSTPVEL